MTMSKPSRLSKPGMSGLTLVEILVGLAVFSILAAVAAPSMLGLLEKRRVIAAAEEVSGILAYAKAETNSINAPLVVRFDPDPSRAMSCAAVTTSGAGFANKCRCYQDPAVICKGAVAELLRLYQLPGSYVGFEAAGTWAGAANQIRFSRDQMTIDTTGFHVDVVGKKYGYKLSVEVNTAGRVKICSPNGDMSGYAKCA